MSNYRDDLCGFGDNPDRALARLYNPCRAKFIGFFKSLYGKFINERDLVDLYHDAIMIMLSKIANGTLLKFTAEPSTYIIGVGKFLVPPFLRRRQRTSLPGDEAMVIPEAHDLGPEVALMSREEQDKLWNAVDDLGDPYKTLLVLTFKNGLTSDEIAELMEYSSAEVVRQTRKRGIDKLRNRFRF